MTLDEIRKAKHLAEEDIRKRLTQLHDETGLFPEMVFVGSIDVTKFEDSRRKVAIGMVEIEFERL